MVDCPLRIHAKKDVCYYTGGYCVPTESCSLWVDSSPKLVEKCKNLSKEDLELFTLMINLDIKEERARRSRRIRRELRK